VLTQRLRWPFALLLLAAPLFSPAARRAGSNIAAGDEGTIVFAYARAAAQACDLSAELGRRAQKLQDVAPKLRAKGAGAALAALLDDDSLSASSKIGGQMSERGARRLFDRLVALGAIRELTGRATFRLYGL
jgi:Skp family chaperone for outer membrane proteins